MATFAETMVAKYEALLQTAAGLDTVSVDGQSVRFPLRQGRMRIVSPHTAGMREMQRTAARSGSPHYPASALACEPFLPRRRHRLNPNTYVWLIVLLGQIVGVGGNKADSRLAVHNGGLKQDARTEIQWRQ